MLSDESQDPAPNNTVGAVEEKADHQKIFWILMLGAIPIIFIQTAIRTALPTMLDDLAVTPAIGQWIVTGYTLIKGIMVPISAFAMNKFRSNDLFLSVLALFGFGSLVAAVGGTFPFVLAGSILQGVAAGIVFPLIQTILFSTFPMSERGSAMGMMGVAMGIGPVFGPSIGGWLVDAWSWQHLYYFLAAFTLIAMIIGHFNLRDMLPHSNPRVDWLSIVFSVFGFGGVLYGMSLIGSEGFLYLPAWIGIVVGALFIWLYIHRILHSNQPLLNIRLLKNKNFLLAILISMFALMVIVGANNIMPIYVQSVLGQTALISGLITMPGAIIKALGSPVAGKIYDNVGIQKLGPIGGGLMVIGAASLLFLTPESNMWFIVITYLAIYGGFTLLNIPITTAGMNTIKEKDLGHGTAVRQTLRGMGSTFATAMAFSSLSFVSSLYAGGNGASVNMAGFRGSFVIVLLFAIAAFTLTFFFKEEREVL